MKKLLKKMQLLFGNAPTVTSFDTQLQTFDDAVRLEHRYSICRLAFGYYDSLPGPFRKFTDQYLKHNRYLYVDYLLRHSALSRLRYSLHNPEQFLCMLHIL